ncbi:uncharacterized protein LOC135486634 [Lineus longissimus]|uniref:uncharacterized protein LOC135486634 n=1 Tax=Lineus longissimus TaxID=88925 RepID=UPI002B4DBB0B
MPFSGLRFTISSLTISVFHIFPQGTIGACIGKNLAFNKPTGVWPADNGTLDQWDIPVNGRRNNPAQTCPEINSLMSSSGRYWFVDLGKGILVGRIIFTFRGHKDQQVGFRVSLFNERPAFKWGRKNCFRREPSILSKPFEVQIVTCLIDDPYRYVAVMTETQIPRLDLHVLICQVEVYSNTTDSDSDRFGNFIASPPFMQPVQKYQVLTVRSRIDCAMMCFKAETCVSFDFTTQTRECDFFNYTSAASASAVLPPFTLDCRIET